LESFKELSLLEGREGITIFNTMVKTLSKQFRRRKDLFWLRVSEVWLNGSLLGWLCCFWVVVRRNIMAEVLGGEGLVTWKLLMCQEGEREGVCPH
jgi:hypothetical protein